MCPAYNASSMVFLKSGPAMGLPGALAGLMAAAGLTLALAGLPPSPVGAMSPDTPEAARPVATLLFTGGTAGFVTPCG